MYVPVEAAAASKLVLHVTVNGEAAAGSPFPLEFARMQLFTQQQPFDQSGIVCFIKRQQQQQQQQPSIGPPRGIVVTRSSDFQGDASDAIADKGTVSCTMNKVSSGTGDDVCVSVS